MILTSKTVGVVATIGLALFPHPVRINEKTKANSPTALDVSKYWRCDRVLYKNTLERIRKMVKKGDEDCRNRIFDNPY